MEHCIIRKLNVFRKVRDIINFISAFVYLTEQTNYLPSDRERHFSKYYSQSAHFDLHNAQN